MEAVMKTQAMFVFALLMACTSNTHVFFYSSHEVDVQSTDFLSEANWVVTQDSGLVRYETDVVPLLPESEYYPCVFLDGQPISEFPRLYFGPEEDSIQVASWDGCFEVRTDRERVIARREFLTLAVSFQGNSEDSLFLEWQNDQLPCELQGGIGSCEFGVIEAGTNVNFRLLKRSTPGYEYLTGAAPQVFRTPWPNVEESYAVCEVSPGQYECTFLQSGETGC